MSAFTVEGLDHVALAVRDVHGSAAWYRDVLGFERRYQDVWGDRPIVVGAGTTSLALFPTEGPYQGGPEKPPGRAHLRHIAFRVDAANFARAQASLQSRGLAFEFQDHAISQSIYFEDPDGYEIEITTYDVP
jgi:catechol 2,3-dioxygenase-like lactoylglutathione lyase family enzyme